MKAPTLETSFSVVKPSFARTTRCAAACLDPEPVQHQEGVWKR